VKLVRVVEAGTGLVVGQAEPQVVDVATAVQRLRERRPDLAGALEDCFPPGGASWRPVIDQWARLRDPLGEIAALAEAGADLGQSPLAGLHLDPPLAEPAARMFAMGGNFPGHVARMGTGFELPESVRHGTPADTPPWGFYVIPGTIVGPGAAVTPPAGVRALDYEAEVAVLLGAGEHPPGRDDITIWGYTAWSDFSIRDSALGYTKTDHGPLTWSLTKNFRTGNSCGPVVVVDEPWPAAGLRIRCRVNGELRQDATTADMTYPFGTIAAHISSYSPLGAGDVIISGTPPGTAMESGADGPFLQDGDVVEVEVDGVGVLRNRIELPGPDAAR
jgi:2-keto-4-pentenoate hydratase/2-oxohepta-3-ene-1,7-dioic acid hydratase in catechol pathway